MCNHLDLEEVRKVFIQFDDTANNFPKHTVAMWVLFQVLLSTMTVRLAIAVVWYP
jgi:hypothetical protein